MTPEVVDEQLVFFPCGGTTLAGVLAIPAKANGHTVLIPWGSGTFPSSGRNRIRTRLARALAVEGFYAFRFDYLGVGESDGEYRKPHMGRPSTDEIVAACAWLESQGLSRILIVANCFGGWSALMAAPMISDLEGVAIINAPVRRDHQQVTSSSWQWWASRLKRLTLGKLRSARHRAFYRGLLAGKASSLLGRSSNGSKAIGGRVRTSFSDAVRYLLDNGIPVLLLYGDGDFSMDLQSVLDDGLRDAIKTPGPPTRLVKMTGRLEGLASLAVQDSLLKELVSWTRELAELPPK